MMHFQPGSRTGALCCGYQRGDRLAEDWDLVNCPKCNEVAVDAAGAFAFRGHNLAALYQEEITGLIRELGGGVPEGAHPIAMVAALREAVEDRVVRVFEEARK